ncbi:MAG: hypothetical protein WCK70_10620 [Chloroflexales bacterium]
MRASEMCGYQGTPQRGTCGWETDEGIVLMMSDDMPGNTPVDESAPPTPPMRRICCLVAPQHRTPSFADHLRAAAVWAQILQGADAAREQAQITETPVERCE